MKTCPVCGAHAFDDAAICFGCLHQFEEWINEASSLEGEPASVRPPSTTTVKTTRMSIVAQGEASPAPAARQTAVSVADCPASLDDAAAGAACDQEEALAEPVEGPQDDVVPVEVYDGENPDAAFASREPPALMPPDSLSVSLPPWDEDGSGWTLRFEWIPAPSGSFVGAGGLVVSLQPSGSEAARKTSPARGCHARVVASACVETSEECVGK